MKKKFLTVLTVVLLVLSVAGIINTAVLTKTTNIPKISLSDGNDTKDEHHHNEKISAKIYGDFLNTTYDNTIGNSVTETINTTTLTFDTTDISKVSIDDDMCWNDIRGGHLYNEMLDNDDLIIFDFDESTYVNDFQIMPRKMRNGGKIRSNGVATSSASDNETIPVESNNATQLYFTTSENVPNYNNFSPNVDNPPIDENTNSDENTSSSEPVPEPAAVLLFGIGLMGIAWSQFRKSKKQQK